MGSFERTIQKNAADAIMKRYRNAFVRVKHGTAFGVVGDPDIYGCIRGRFFGLECKDETGQLTKIQKYQLMELAKAGAIQGGIRSAQDALDILERYLT